MRRHFFIMATIMMTLSFFLAGMGPSWAASLKTTSEHMGKINAKFDPAKLSDMSDYDPNNLVIPKGDTIKIGIVGSFSGPAAVIGQIFSFCVGWVAHDINKRGGIWVDGKKKLIEIIKADNMSTPDGTKKACERLVLQEKVHVLWGTSTSHMTKIMDQVAHKYKVIAMNIPFADELQDAENFSRYAFMTAYSSEQIGRGFAYYYGQIRKKEKKFYILAQDTMSGRTMAEGFMKGLKEYYPESQLVGEDYHKMFLTDFAPYLTKVKASGDEVIYNPSAPPDGVVLIKQARQMGINLPFAFLLCGDPVILKGIGVEGSKGLVLLNQNGSDNPFFKSPGHIKFYKAWNDLWKSKWKAPYNTLGYEHPFTALVAYIDMTYWLMSVIERAGSTDPEKIIKTWEGDTYQFLNGGVAKMRACDHKAIHQLGVTEFVPPEQQKQSFNIPPYYWSKEYSFYGPAWKIPVEKALPWMDQTWERCHGKNDWGE